MAHLVCIGAQRAATTWLFRSLRDLYYDKLDTTVKEVHYFNQVWIPEHREWCIKHRDKQAFEELKYIAEIRDFDGLLSEGFLYKQFCRLTRTFCVEPTDAWYKETIMNSCDNPDSFSLDFTPEYALLPIMGIAHMDRLCPRAHYVFIVRNPIERAYSHLRKLNHDEGLQLDPDTIACYIDGNVDIVQRSDYRNTIDLFLSVIDPDRFHVIVQDDIVKEPAWVLESLVASIGLEPREIDPAFAHRREHQSSNNWSYSLSEVELLKSVLWDRFSTCYNNLDDLQYIPTGEWRESAEAFLDSLQDDKS